MNYSKTVYKLIFVHSANSELVVQYGNSFYSNRYGDETKFEIHLQTTEISLSKYISEGTALEITNTIRLKYYDEKKMQPVFSYI
jgi:hypothetical protein